MSLQKWMKSQNKKTGGYYGAIGGGFTTHTTVKNDLPVECYVENGITRERFYIVEPKKVWLDNYASSIFDKIKKKDTNYLFSQTFTSLGCATEVVNMENMEKTSLTDYESW